MARIAAQGPPPAGMLRIQQGNQERYVWPVHLPGWLALGWRVAGAEAPSDGTTAAEPPAPIAGAAGELPDQGDAKPATARGKRGRRRKDEAQPEAPADTGASTVNDNSNDGSDAIGPEPTAEVPLGALPDDLFSDPLI
jgi:hypothetical protein